MIGAVAIDRDTVTQKVDPTPSIPRDGEPVPKLSALVLPTTNEWTVHPAWTEATSSVDGTAVDAHLPTALGFPLTDLWRVRRPGPKLQLFALRGE